MKTIPKIIHYCWFGGGNYPHEVEKCIDSWKKKLSDYEIIEWNEKNYDVNKWPFMKWAYSKNKWAFVSDMARLDIIYNYGGIYLDTDVEVLKPFDELLSYELFIGFDDDNYLNTGMGFGAIKGNILVYENLKQYIDMAPEYIDKELKLVTCPRITTKVFQNYGFVMNNCFQNINNNVVLPREYLCPLNFYTGSLCVTENSFSIHKCSMSWQTDRDRKWHEREKRVANIFGRKVAKIFVNGIKFIFTIIISCRQHGVCVTIDMIKRKVKSYRCK